MHYVRDHVVLIATNRTSPTSHALVPDPDTPWLDVRVEFHKRVRKYHRSRFDFFDRGGSVHMTVDSQTFKLSSGSTLFLDWLREYELLRVVATLSAEIMASKRVFSRKKRQDKLQKARV